MHQILANLQYIPYRRAYYASISYVDSLVGELLETLETCGLDKNTSIVFTSDHGYQLGEHKMWNKNTNFEIANHVGVNSISLCENTILPFVT